MVKNASERRFIMEVSVMAEGKFKNEKKMRTVSILGKSQIQQHLKYSSLRRKERARVVI